MRLTVDEVVVQMIDEILEMCKNCEYLERAECKEPYSTRKEVVLASLSKFSELDCSPKISED